MTAFETEPFAGFSITGRPFWIKGVDLIVSRNWKRSRVGNVGIEDGKFSLISGKAIAQGATVCRIGSAHKRSEFRLTMESDANAREHWEFIKGIKGWGWRGTQEGADTPEQRLTARIQEILNKEPPTATLFVGEGEWVLECRIPLTMLVQFEDDFRSGRTGEINMSIDWVGGLQLLDTWGLFCLNERQDVEPLLGHVVSLGWDIPVQQTPPIK